MLYYIINWFIYVNVTKTKQFLIRIISGIYNYKHFYLNYLQICTREITLFTIILTIDIVSGVLDIILCKCLFRVI